MSDVHITVGIASSSLIGAIGVGLLLPKLGRGLLAIARWRIRRRG